jgi:hypothetical protein
MKLADVIEMVGLIAVAVGFFLWWLPLGFIVSGILLVLWGIATTRKGELNAGTTTSERN